MPLLPDEQPISLDKLDDRLKAILKIKIREFVHLNPIFNCIPSIDVSSYCTDMSKGAAKQSAHGEIPQILRQEVTRETIQSMPDNLVQAAAAQFAATPYVAPEIAPKVVAKEAGQKAQSDLTSYLDGLEAAASNANNHMHRGDKAKEVSGELTLQPRTYFAGYDEECPNRYKPAPPRRRYARRVFI